jgi:hypothetical protein
MKLCNMIEWKIGNNFPFGHTQVQIRIRTQAKIHGSKTTFEFGPNLLGVQTSLEKSNKFPKILICLYLADCEFILAWLYGEI